MRKAFALFLICILSISGFARFAVHSLAAPTEAVTFSETVLYGDPSAAKGLTVDRNVQFNDHLLWSSNIDFREDGYYSQTDFTCSAKTLTSRFGSQNSSNIGLEMFNNYPDEYRVDGADADNVHGLQKAKLELIEETAPGTTGEKTVRIADYMDEYLFNININLPDLIYGYFPDIYDMDASSNPEATVIQTIQKYFTIPVLEDEYYHIGIDKDFDGNVIGEFGGSAELGDSFPMYTQSVVADDAIYFCFDNRTSNGARVDTSRIPDGYGIYVLPYGSRIKDGKKYQDVFAEDLHTIYPLDPQTDILTLSLSSDQKTLHLHTVENGTYSVTFIDIATGEARQKLALADYSLEADDFQVFTRENYAVIRISHSFYVLAEKPDDSWELVFRTTPKSIELEPDYLPLSSWLEPSISFDGEKLAVCGHASVTGTTDDSIWRDYGCGFYAAIYDADGLQYYGLYDSSLQQTYLSDPPWYGYNLHPFELNDGNVQWN